MGAGPLVVTYPLTGRSRAVLEEELGGTAEAVYLVDLAPLDRAHALGRAGAVLSHDTSKELRPDEILLIRNARLLQFTAAGVDWVPTRDLAREWPVAANMVAAGHQTDTIHLLFNNAGISGGGSMVTNSRDEWERTFNICWGGVYNCTRAFLPMLQNAEEGHIVNTSSINGFWASIGPRIPHTAYSAAKFAVKGFTEALITDLRINAPHIKCSVVMPGQIGTSIRANTRKIHSGDRESDAIDAAGLAQARERFALLGRDVSQLSDDQLHNLVAELERRFRDEALTSAAQAATIILDGVKADRWRILVGADAHNIDEMARQSLERAYDIAFFDEFARAAGWTKRLSLENPELSQPS